MDLCWIVLTDGRKHYIEKALPTWIKQYDSLIENKFILDDSGEEPYRQWLLETFPTFEIVNIGEARQGYAKAIQKVFKLFRDTGCKYAFHLEDDFILHKPFDFDQIIYVLESNKNLAQMSIMRQPWYHNEKAAGGVIEALEKNGSTFKNMNTGGMDWVEHKAYYTCNPNIIPRYTTDYPWPDGNWTESRFAQNLFKKKKSCGIWGNRNSWPDVEHIGEERYGKDY